MEKGTVVYFNVKKGYGFISWFKNNQKQKDMFIHYSDINMNGFKVLSINQAVEFELGKNIKGDPKAINVKVIS